MFDMAGVEINCTQWSHMTYSPASWLYGVPLLNSIAWHPPGTSHGISGRLRLRWDVPRPGRSKRGRWVSTF